MNCIAPLPITVKRFTYRWEKQRYEVPCGHCLPCLIQKQSQLEFLSKKELLSVYASGRGASFVTLTYDDDHIPLTDSGMNTLRRRDLQLWLKNMRRQMDYYNENIPFKMIYCGEYGDKFQRPHYHLVFLGLSDVQVTKYCRKLWRYGLCQVGPLGQGGLRYLIKYITKTRPNNEIKALREQFGVESPFIGHSIGLGKDWIVQNMWRIANDGYQFNINGKKYFYPKYICRFVALHTGIPYKTFFLKSKCEELKTQVKRYGFKNIQELKYDINLEEKEQQYLKYNQIIASLRSKNKPVDKIDLDSIHWIKPRAKIVNQHYRKELRDLADYCIYGDVVPF